ncbi:MAG TPA: ash family protein [Enterobacteriaceae bacterium]|nr:ash family protein [Enterobacteriaceae bacterium]
MVGWTGAPQGAPVPDKAGSSNPVQSTTREIGTSGGGLKTTYRRLPPWLLSSPGHTRCLPFPLAPPRTSPSWPIIANASRRR